MALRRLNPRPKPLHLPRPFSSSSSSSSPPFPPPPPPPDDPDSSASSPPPNPNSSASSSPPPNPNNSSYLFSDIRERLKSSPTPPLPRRIPTSPPRPNATAQSPLHPTSLADIRRTLQSFRMSRPSPPPTTSSNPISFQQLLRTPPAPNTSAGPNPNGFRIDAIRDSFNKLDPRQQQQRPPAPPMPFLSSVPDKIFGRELLERHGKVGEEGKEEEDADSAVTLMRDYSYDELGKRLGALRPAGAGKDGKEFSLEELHGRIVKLVEKEKEEEDPRFGGQFRFFRKSLQNIKKTEEKKKSHSVQSLSALINITGQATPLYMLKPPQEELLERYFHPDHMSSEEKMKLELQKVRDEFKMSENDCGSARLQVAQLTVKIKHLSSVLHKKDKHSRKGLQEMVQRRKKFLKYLRRTDWDSYCLVLSKLGLRDVPEYRAPDYKSKASSTKAKTKSKSKSKKKMKA